MHSGVMRQSLIDVTPFMPVSDFICEYCSCVIIREEQALATQEAAEARIEEHSNQLAKEEKRKLQATPPTTPHSILIPLIPAPHTHARTHTHALTHTPTLSPTPSLTPTATTTPTLTQFSLTPPHPIPGGRRDAPGRA